MQLETWKINGRGFHFGRHGLGQEETRTAFPSDSLFAALVARLVELEGSHAAEDFLRPFKSGDPPFVLSSTFPFAGDVRFFPALAPSAAPAGEHTPYKDLKRVLFLSEGLFRRALGGEALGAIYASATPLQRRQVLVSQPELSSLPSGLQKEAAQLWQREQRPRVTLGRSAQNSNLFFTGRIGFAEGCGLWFAIRWLADDTGLKARVANLLADLGEAGLGGERSAGFGVCQIQPADALELPSAERRHWTNLSRYLPRQDELQALADPLASYRLEVIGGWLDSPIRRGQRRRPVNLIAEGAVLGPLERLAPGRVEDMRPRYPTDPDPLGHPVYRSGLALAVGLKGGSS